MELEESLLMPVYVVLSIYAFLRNIFFLFLSWDHLTVTDPVAILKADEVWGALRGKLILFLYVLGLCRLCGRLRTRWLQSPHSVLLGKLSWTQRPEGYPDVCWSHPQAGCSASVIQWHNISALLLCLKSAKPTKSWVLKSFLIYSVN